MFGCAPGGGPTTLLGGPLRSKAPQQTFPPASCPDGKPVPPASCPDGKPVQTAGRSRRQAGPDGKPPFLPAFCQTSPAFRSRATPNLPCPTAPTFCRRAIALRPHPRLSPASHTQKPPPGRATLTPHSSALDTTPMPPRHRPVPSSCPNRLAPPRSPLFRHSILSSSDFAARDWLPRTLAFTLSPNTPPSPLITTHTLTCTHDSPLRNKPPLPCSAPSPSPPGPDRTQKNARTTQGAGVGITE